MQMAGVISARSTCSRLHVGAIITNSAGTQIVAMGYNGNARGFPNSCDSDEPGNCGCIHAECNALIKAPPDEGKILYTTHSPCVACAKMVINAGVARVVYADAYRNPAGIDLLTQARIFVMQLVVPPL